jgi:TolB protein
MSSSSIWNLNTVRRSCLAIPVFVAALVLGMVSGAYRITSARNVPEIYGRIVKSGGDFEPTRIGIDEFTIKNAASPADARDLAALAGRVVFNDLDFSYLFEAVRPDTVYLRIMNQSQIDRRGWHYLGAAYLIEGEVEVDGDNVAVTYTLFDLVNDREVFRRRLKSRRQTIRLLSHSLSDEVYRELAGAEGIFQTRLTYLRRDTYNEVHVCDYDGANDLVVASERSIIVTPRWAGSNAVSYTSYKERNPDVWILDLTKGRAQKLSSQPGLNSGCSWTRDGKRYVLSLSVDGSPEIYIAERDGKPRRLTFSNGIDASPSFAPDGKRIVFTSDRSGTPQVYIMDDDGTNLARLSFEGKYNDSPDWSPTLDMIAYVARMDGVFQICTIRPDGSGYRQLTEVGSNENPHWSPDGLHLVFSSNRTGVYEIYTMGYDGSGVRRITNSGGNNNPGWSP